MQLNCVYRAGLLAAAALCSEALWASDGPFFVTYSHQMEEQGNLEVATKTLTGQPGGGNRFFGTATEFEYGLLGWWTTELYLDGQSTVGESTLYTGLRWENRFRLLKHEHAINPVLYLEYENLTGADRAVLEVVGHDGEADWAEPNDQTRRETKHELEAKLILGSNWRGWNFSENLIFEKNLSHAPWEFGYAIGTYRPLALTAGPNRCNFCRENFRLGVEAYGGLGDTSWLSLRDTSHYVAPGLEWSLANGTVLKISPGFGVTEASAPFLLRFGVSYEIAQFARRLRGR